LAASFWQEHHSLGQAGCPLRTLFLTPAHGPCILGFSSWCILSASGDPCWPLSSTTALIFLPWSLPGTSSLPHRLLSCSVKNHVFSAWSPPRLPHYPHPNGMAKPLRMASGSLFSQDSRKSLLQLSSGNAAETSDTPNRSVESGLQYCWLWGLPRARGSHSVQQHLSCCEHSQLSTAIRTLLLLQGNEIAHSIFMANCIKGRHTATREGIRKE
jgi:hypothetical protein